MFKMCSFFKFEFIHPFFPIGNRAIGLESSFATHHHLPNIPSAAEVEKEGILIGDMQKKMMEKIEELTLYILQLEEKYSQLAAQLDLVQGKQN